MAQDGQLQASLTKPPRTLEGPGVTDLTSQSTSGALGPGLMSPQPKALVDKVNNEERPHSYPMLVLGLFLSKSDLSPLLKHFCG